MKVSYEGKVRKLRSFPLHMTDFRKEVSRKYTDRCLIEEDDPKMSNILES
jgi:hypothetical protein